MPSKLTIEQAYQTASPLEEFSAGITRQFLANHQIVAHNVTQSSRATLDAAYEMISDTLKDWPTDQLYLALNDFSTLKVTSMSPSEKRLLETHYLYPDVVGFVAIIIPTGVVGQILRMYFSTRVRLSREVHAFFSKQEALQFLLNKLNAEYEADASA